MGSPSDFTDEHYVPTVITRTFPIRVTIPGSSFTNGQAIRATRFYKYPRADATGMEQLNNRLFYINLVAGDTFSLYDNSGNGIDGTNYTPFVANGLAQFTLTGPDLFVENNA